MSFPLDVCRSLTESICWKTTKRVGLAAYSDGASASSHNDPHLAMAIAYRICRPLTLIFNTHLNPLPWNADSAIRSKGV
jgi:hypothetical protein